MLERNMSSAPAQVFVALLDEGTSVWRPVSAVPLGGDEFQIIGIVPPDESWQFSPGTQVRCKEHVFASGAKGLVAYDLVDPGGKKGRNKFVGSYMETPPKNIDLSFTAEALRTVLQFGATPDSSPYTHQDIAHWCDCFHTAMLDCDTDQKMNVATDIAADIGAQWDMYLANTYSLEALQKLEYSTVRLPLEWFSNWLIQLESGEIK